MADRTVAQDDRAIRPRRVRVDPPRSQSSERRDVGAAERVAQWTGIQARPHHAADDSPAGRHAHRDAQQRTLRRRGRRQSVESGLRGLGGRRQRPALLSARSAHGDIIRSLRTLDAKGQNVFLSEYGIGSTVDLWRTVRHFEQRGAANLEDAQYFQGLLERFADDWKRWRLDDTFGRQEDFFMASLRKMAGQRTLGLNAIRSNPNIVGHSVTGAIDHVMCGEGLTTLFRELKPGTVDAMFDAWAPLRWCLFAEPVHIRRGRHDPPGSRAGQRGRVAARRLSGASSGDRSGWTPCHGSPDQGHDCAARRQARAAAGQVVLLRRRGGRRADGQVPLRGDVRTGRGGGRRRDRVLRDRSGRHAGGRNGGRSVGRRSASWPNGWPSTASGHGRSWRTRRPGAR